VSRLGSAFCATEKIPIKPETWENASHCKRQKRTVCCCGGASCANKKNAKRQLKLNGKSGKHLIEKQSIIDR